MRKILTAATTLALCLTLLAACQPTPDKPAVVQKNDGKLEEKISQSSAPVQKYEAPKHWKETYTRDKLKVEFDADITMPNVDKYPVVKVEPLTLTQQRVDELVNYFAAGKKLYRYPAVKTKADYAAEIVEAKRGQEVDGKFVVTEDSKAWVKELEQRMSQAPDTYQREYVDTMLDYEREYESAKENTEYGKNYLSVAVDTGSKDDPNISLSNYVQSHGGGTGFGYYIPYQDGTAESFYIQDLKNEPANMGGYDDARKKRYEAIFASIPDSVKEEYLAKAQKAMDDLGVKDVVLVKTDKVALQGAADTKPQKGGYLFEFMRASGGIAGYMPQGGSRHKDEEPPAYTIPFMQEQVDVTVSDGEIAAFHWYGQVKVTETQSENVALLPFDQIQEKVKNQIYYKDSFLFKSPFTQGMTDNVTSAELRVGYIGIKDHPGQALLVPIWVFHTQQSMTIPTDPRYPEKGSKTMPGNREDYMFNAIDGGVIEIDFGRDK